MATQISRIYSAKPVSEEAEQALVAFDEDLAAAIRKAKESGILQGFLVSMLAARFIEETNTLNSMTAD